MPFIILLLCAIAGTVSSCDAAHALQEVESKQEYDERIDFDSIKSEVHKMICTALACPASVHIDELQIHGNQFASIKIGAHYVF